MALIQPLESSGARIASSTNDGDAASPLRVEGAVWRALGLSVTSELRQALRNRADVAQPLLFFVVVASLFPLGIGADSARLAQLAPGLIWVCGLLAVLLSLPRLYARDAANGTLEQLLLSPYPLAALAAGKMVAHWLLTGLPLALLAPVLGVAFGLPAASIALLVATLVIGTPILSMIGAIGAALALGARASPLLIGVLVLPLYVPVLVFGAGALDAQAFGVGFEGPLLLLVAGVLFGAVIAPFGTALALRIALE
jgi:heme exporter protein B